jgi:hypothetical protein
MVENVWIMANKGIDARHETNVSRVRSPAKSADTIRDPCWQRPDLTWEHSLGLSPDVRGRDVPIAPSVSTACWVKRGEATAYRRVLRRLLADGFAVARRLVGHEQPS